MTWFKVDDSLAFHAKTVAAGNAAMGLWVRAGSWSAQQLTDGFVPDHMVTTLGTRGQAKALAEVGLWHRDGNGYTFHCWLDYNPTAEEVRADQARKHEAKVNAGRAGGLASGVARRKHTRSRGEAKTKQDPKQTGSETKPRPDPSRPVPSLDVETSVGNATEVDAPRDPNEPPKCRQHKGMLRAYVPDCLACARKRQQWETSRAAEAEFGRAPWCGDDECNPITRKRTTPFGDILCPECHPLAEEAS